MTSQLKISTFLKQHWIILVCGLPGVGKSSICRILLKKLSDIVSSLNGCLAHVEFDDIFRRLQTSSEAYSSHMTSSISSETFDSILWKHSRRIAFEYVENLIKDLSPAPSTQPSQFDCHFIIVDDNFFYKSMRVPFFRLAQKYGCRYMLLYITASLERILTNNRKRPPDRRVPDSIIREMSRKFEKPRLFKQQEIQARAKSPTESNESDVFIGIKSFEIHPDAVYYGTSSTSSEGKHFFVIDTNCEENEIESQVPWRPIFSCLQSPSFGDEVLGTSSIEVQVEERERSRRGNRESLLHQIDLRTRHVVSQRMREYAIRSRTHQHHQNQTNNNDNYQSLKEQQKEEERNTASLLLKQRTIFLECLRSSASSRWLSVPLPPISTSSTYIPRSLQEEKEEDPTRLRENELDDISVLDALEKRFRDWLFVP